MATSPPMWEPTHPARFRQAVRRAAGAVLLLGTQPQHSCCTHWAALSSTHGIPVLHKLTVPFGLACSQQTDTKLSGFVKQRLPHLCPALQASFLSNSDSWITWSSINDVRNTECTPKHKKGPPTISSTGFPATLPQHLHHLQLLCSAASPPPSTACAKGFVYGALNSARDITEASLQLISAQTN